MPEYVVNHFFSNSGTRNEVRMRVVNELAAEIPGAGRGELTSKYTYYVEHLNDSSRVYLRRPANLHWGFDFIVCVENYDFRAPEERRKRNYPKHDDIIRDLCLKHEQHSTGYSKLYNLMLRIYECDDISDEEIEILPSMGGYPCDMILKTIKWLFIEQDIRYWNYSGRDMLWNGIPKPLTEM